jgi:hypothetical protein
MEGGRCAKDRRDVDKKELENFVGSNFNCKGVENEAIKGWK